jgi:hypothetical protein
MDTLANALRDNGITCAAITGKVDYKPLDKEDDDLLDFQNVNRKIEGLLISLTLPRTVPQASKFISS